MANVNQNPTYRAQNKYYGHDLSQHLEFTSPTGQLLPVYYDVLNPGEKVSINTYMKTRTQPLASAAMMRMNEYLEWYFVPLNQIYKPFGNWFYGIQDFGSSMFIDDNVGVNTKMSEKFPFISADKLRQFYFSVATTPQAGNTERDTLKGDDYYSAFVRLASHLGINDETLLDHIDGMDGPYFSITPLLFCAYQKIWMDHYRLSDRIDNDPRSFNLDQFFQNLSSLDPDSSMGFNALLQMFMLRYRPLSKDFYTNNFPSPLFGSQSVGAQAFEQNTAGTLYKVNQWLTSLMGVSTIDSSGDNNFERPTTSVIRDVQSNLPAGDFNKANIQTMFATDKLLEITRRSGKHYDAQTLAHFGVEVPDNIEGQSYYLGRSVQELVVGDVISNAATEDAPLGEIAGKGYAVGSGKTIKFDAPCHGVLMCLYSSAPVVDYYQEGLDKLNCLIEKTDYFLPEFDNLGMQPLFGYQCKIADNSLDNSMIRGWQYRYFEFKQKMNRIICGLKYTQKHWTVGKSSDTAGYDSSDYYVSPNALGPTMLYQYNFGKRKVENKYVGIDNSSELFESDPLIHEISFDVRKASEMTTYGLMEL